MESLKEFLLTLSIGNQRLQNSITETFNLQDKKLKDGKRVAWEKYNFYDMPAVGALTLLSKMQSDIRNVEANVIDYLKKDIDAKSLKFTSAEGIQIPQSNFVLRGDSFRSQIFITANNPDQNPDIYVGEFDSLGNGKYEMKGEEGVDYETVKVINGKGIFTRRTSSEGTKKWGGLIKMKTESGTKIYPFKGEYLVASKQAVASPTNMAVLYKNIDNPIKVSVAGYSASQITASSRNGTIKLVNKSNGEWIVKPTKLQNNLVPIIDLYITEDGRRKNMGSVEFKVKKVPDPYPKAAGLKKWTVSRTALKGAQMLIAEMKNFPFDREALSFGIKSYNIIAYNGDGDRLTIPTVKGAKFNEDVIIAIENTAPGGNVTFTDIIAINRSNKKDIRPLGSIVYKIK
jgi:gliding motility-associated protein GldM